MPLFSQELVERSQNVCEHLSRTVLKHYAIPESNHPEDYMDVICKQNQCAAFFLHQEHDSTPELLEHNEWFILVCGKGTLNIFKESIMQHHSMIGGDVVLVHKGSSVHFSPDEHSELIVVAF